jgi:ATP-dependent RNA helicase DeaD
MMEKFRKLGIMDSIIKVIEEERFEVPSEIQEKAIPLVVGGKDIIAGSATGSGKTLVFGAGIIQNCVKGRGIQSLVLTPTRELAEQIARMLRKFAKYNPLNITAIYGGVAIGPQFSNLKSADVVVGTPGRILDHLSRESLDLSKLKILVLDEADRMFDMGFINDVEKIIGLCPKQRQTLLFSATISKEVSLIGKKYMKSPVEISAETYVDPKMLTQCYYDVPDNLKFSLLVHLLKKEVSGLAMIFCNTQRSTDFVAKNLKTNGIKVLAIHGGFSQAKRNQIMKQFHSMNFHVLVCTDVAARGLDIKGVTHIYNYDIPKESKQYIHRIGRTARAGKEGKAINVLSSRDYDDFNRVLRELNLEIEKIEMPEVERVAFIRQEGRPPKERFGRRGSRPRPTQGNENRRTSGSENRRSPGNENRRFSRRRTER